jgi:murein L,D-transpeptidase YcbB/YkuD
LRRIISTRVETTLKLRQPILVMLLYMTAWVDEQGRVQFRHDIYGRDHSIPVASAP